MTTLYIKLAYKNVRAGSHDYLLYFLTLALTIGLFYCFNTSGTLQLLNINDLTSSIPGLLTTLNNMMRFLSFFIAVLLGAMVLYANRLFLFRRRQEFSLYYVLGMRQSHLLLILLLETLFIALIAFAVGLLFGILLSQLICTFTASLFVSHVSYHFVFSFQALFLTLGAFCAIFFLTTFANILLLIFRPIRNSHIQQKESLFQLTKKGSILHLTGSILCFSTALFLIFRKTEGVTFAAALILFFLSDLLFFPCICTLLNEYSKTTNSLRFHSLNMITLRQIYLQISRNLISLCILTIMLTLGISSLFAGLCISNNLNRQVDSLTPYSFSLIHQYSFDNKQNDYNGLMFESDIKKLVYTDPVLYQRTIHTYASKFTLGSLIRLLDDEQNDLPHEFEKLNQPIEILPLSAYNQLRIDQGYEKIKMKVGEVFLYTCNPHVKETINAVLKQQPQIQVFSNPVQISKKHITPLRPCTVLDNVSSASIYLVVPDVLVPVNARSYADYWNVQLAAPVSTRAFAVSIADQLTNGDDILMPEQNIYIADSDLCHENSIGSSVLFTYISLYAGIILIICAAIILSLKQLSPLFNVRCSSKLLEHIGAPLSMRRRTIFVQTFVFFLLPLAIACLQSLFIVKGLANVLYEVGFDGYPVSFLQTFLIVIFVYTCYFSITYYSRLSVAEMKK